MTNFIRRWEDNVIAEADGLYGTPFNYSKIAFLPSDSIVHPVIQSNGLTGIRLSIGEDIRTDMNWKILPTNVYIIPSVKSDHSKIEMFEGYLTLIAEPVKQNAIGNIFIGFIFDLAQCVSVK